MPLYVPSADAAGVPDSFVSPCHPALIAASNTNTANTLVGCRVIVPKNGQLRDVSCYVKLSSGNLIGAVYDTGNALAASRTKLWDSGSVACGSSGAWQILGDPNIAVTKGQHLDLMVATDNGTVELARTATLLAAAQLTMPTGFWACAGGASPKLGFRVTPGSFTAPATVAEADVAVIASTFVLIARIS